MDTSDYLDGSQEYESLYPQTIMETDSKESLTGVVRKNQNIMRLYTKHFDCFCGKIFSSKADFNRHMLVHTGERPHECEFCDKTFSLKGNLTKHMQLHTDEKSYHCPVCGKAFLKKGYIDQHMRIHTGEKPFVCMECNRAFSLKGNLAQHMKLHTDEKSFSCLECNKLFLKKSYLVQHMRVHAGYKPHKCHLCSRAFTLKGNLDQHLKRHSGRKPFKCDECGKAFALKGALKEHEKVHGGDKPFICLVCSKAFNKKAYLIQHERTHTGERPFPCLECGKAFSQRSILNQHMRQHGERSYKCAQCHKLFVKKLTELPKNTRTVRSGVLRCKGCEASSEDPSVEDVMQGFLKGEHSVDTYDSESYTPNDGMTLYNLDGSHEEGIHKPTLTNLLPMSGAACSSTHNASGEASSRIYDFNPNPMQSSIPRDPADVRNCMNYSQKKVAYAHAMAKSSVKKTNESQGKTTTQRAEASSDIVKKADMTYTELKVANMREHPGMHPNARENREGIPIAPVIGVDTQNHSSSNERKYKSSSDTAAGDPKTFTSESSEGISNQILDELTQRAAAHSQHSVDNSNVKEMADKTQRTAPKPAVDDGNSSKPPDDAIKRNIAGDRPLEYMYKKHPALMGMEPQGPPDFGQRSAFLPSGEAEVNDAKRAFMYGTPSLTEYNARYLESLRDPFQRGFPGIRQGPVPVPEMESALSRFGFKGYYNTPWPFAGNYPD